MVKHFRIFATLIVTLYCSLVEAGWTFPPINVSSTIPTFLPSTTIQMDTDGNAIAVWISANQKQVISAVLPANTTTWVVTTIFTAAVNQTVGSLSLAVSPSGNSVAVWGLNQGAFPMPVTGIVEGATLLSGSVVWSAPIIIGNETSRIINVSVDVDDVGNAVAVWSKFNGINIRGATLTFPAIWTAPFNVTTTAGGQLDRFATAIVDPARNAVIMWVNINFITSTFTVQSRTLSNTNILGPILIAETNASIYTAKGDAAGDVIAIFQEGSAITGAILPANASAWIPTTDLTTFASSFSLAVNDNGDAVAVWADVDGVIKGATLRSGSTTWNKTADLAGPNNSDPHVAIDAAGNAYADWIPDTSIEPGAVQAAVLPFRTSVWRGVTNLTVVSSDIFSLNTGIAVNPSGSRAVAIWTDETLSLVQSAIGTDLFQLPSPATNARGRVVSRKYLLQSTEFNQIRWSPSTDPFVTEYQIFRDGVLIGTVSSAGPFVFSDCRRSGGPVTYTIVAINDAGMASDPVSVTIN